MVEILVNDIWSGDYNLVDKVLSNFYKIHHDPGDAWEGKTLDRKEFIKRIEATKSVFPDLEFEIQDLFGNRDKISVSWLMSGTHLGNLGKTSPTKKKIKIPGITIYNFEKNLIAGHWQVFDRLELYRQLGLTSLK
jgi:predicted ester cyclase